MSQTLAHVALVVGDYDEAIAFYVDVLGFDLVEDTYQPEQDKRWVVVRPNGGGTSILLAPASNDHQQAYVGDQAGGGAYFCFCKPMISGGTIAR